jgi:saccharopine dehydrogenase (NAD+, L-lysine-forming)
MTPTLWLRAETKPGERRSPLTPRAAAALVADGVDVVVERSDGRIFSDPEYVAAGCRLVDKNTWTAAPKAALIFGLKELPASDAPLIHRHIYFAHAFKQQPAAAALLGRFRQGGGTLLDLEYLADAQGRRIAAFGHWAGFVGAALAVKTFVASVQDRTLGSVHPFASARALIEEVQRDLASLRGTATKGPCALVTGHKGRSGRGAMQLLSEVAVRGTGWDLEETQRGGPFEEILGFDLLVHCVLVSSPHPPFLTEPLLDRERSLRVVADVTCDAGSPWNLVPVYKDITTFGEPARRVRTEPPLDVIAIDHLPSLLPRESSEDFCEQLLPHLRALLCEGGSSVWTGAEALFRQKLEA